MKTPLQIAYERDGRKLYDFFGKPNSTRAIMGIRKGARVLAQERVTRNTRRLELRNPGDPTKEVPFIVTVTIRQFNSNLRWINFQ